MQPRTCISAEVGAVVVCDRMTLCSARRAAEVLLLLKKEVELCKLQADIGKRVEEKISSDQRRYFLTEQLRSIKKELGLEKDDKSALIQKCAARCHQWHVEL